MPSRITRAALSVVNNRARVRTPGEATPEQRPSRRAVVGDADFVRPYRTATPDLDEGDFLSDWNCMFDAVRERLTSAVAASTADAGAASDPDAAQTGRAVLECVSALEQLQASAGAELLRREGLETAVFDAQTSLAQVRAALVGSQHGEREARYLATHDSLTSLPNRAFLLERINEELSGTHPDQSRFALMFLDLNGFKGINDNHGHAAGDELLRIVAARLRGVVRAQDMVSRAGGDEFACLIGSLQDRTQLGLLADKMADAIAAPCTMGSLQVTVKASVGITISPVDGSSADVLLKHADLAMYVAKRQQVVYSFYSHDDMPVAQGQEQGVAP